MKYDFDEVIDRHGSFSGDTEIDIEEALPS